MEEDLPEGAGMGNEQQRQEQQENTHQQRLLQHTEPLHTLPEQVLMLAAGFMSIAACENRPCSPLQS